MKKIHFSLAGLLLICLLISPPLYSESFSEKDKITKAEEKVKKKESKKDEKKTGKIQKAEPKCSDDDGSSGWGILLKVIGSALESSTDSDEPDRSCRQRSNRDTEKRLEALERKILEKELNKESLSEYETDTQQIVISSLTPKSAIRDLRFNPFPNFSPDKGLYADSTGQDISMYSRINYFLESSELHGWDYEITLSPSSYLSINLNGISFIEDLEKTKDYLSIANLHLSGHLIRSDKFNLWAGIGPRNWHGDSNYLGLSYSAGFKWFPAKPVSFTGNFTGGKINDARVSEFKSSINFHLKHCVFQTGYKIVDVGGVVFKGALFGIGIYF